MDDKDIELITQILKAGGSAASDGFEQLVHWQMVDGITTVVVCVLLVVFLSWLLSKLIAWRPEDEFGALPRGFGICITAVGIFVTICFLQSGLRDALAPEGAAVYTVLHGGK